MARYHVVGLVDEVDGVDEVDNGVWKGWIFSIERGYAECGAVVGNTRAVLCRYRKK